MSVPVLDGPAIEGVTMRTASFLSIVVAVGMVVLSGCGSDDDRTGQAGGASPDGSSSAPTATAVPAALPGY